MTSNLERIAAEALAIEQEEARQAGTLGFMARVVVQATLPHRNPKASEFERRNGDFVLSLMAPKKIGLPFGRYPRLLLAWVATEAVRTKDPELHLGDSLSGFMAELGLTPTGGRWGTITRLRLQVQRLFASTISATIDRRADGEWIEAGFRVARSTNLWWDPKKPDQLALYGSTVMLSQEFFESVVDRPIPVDMRALKALRSPLALDLYTWLTWRMSYLGKPTEIPWEALALQFGSDYKQLRQFKAAVLKQLATVLQLYPEARVAEGRSGLVLKPSPTHVRKLVE